MNDDATGEPTPDPNAEAAKWAAKAADMKVAAETVVEDMARDPELQQEWGRQNNQIYGALIAIGLVWVQPFLALGVPSTAARVCVVAFSVAIPLLAGLMLLSRQEEFRRSLAKSWLVTTARSLAQPAAVVGVVAGFWHIYWVAGVTLMAAGLKKVMTYIPRSKDS